MSADPLARLLQQAADHQDHTVEADSRRRGRLPLELLECNLGQVIDMSAGGMRVKASVLPQGKTEVTFPEHPLPETLTAQVVWSEECNEESWLCGLEWVGLTKALAAELTVLATTHRDRLGLTLADDDVA